MDDKELIDLYFKRDENAIKDTERLYGSRLRALAYRLLADKGNTEECLNETYFKVWNAVPPHRPLSLYAFCAAVCRRTAMDRAEYNKLYIMFLSDKYKLSGKELFSAIEREHEQLEKLREGEQSDDDADSPSTDGDTAVKHGSFPRNNMSEGALNE